MPADKIAMMVAILSRIAGIDPPEPENQAMGPICGLRIQALRTVTTIDAITKLVIGRL